MGRIKDKSALDMLRNQINDLKDIKDRSARRQRYCLTALLFKSFGHLSSDEFKMFINSRNRWYGKKITKKKKDTLQPKVEEVRDEAVDLMMHGWEQGGEDADTNG
jgi:hypothetical protein